MHSVGIDLSADPKKTAGCRIDWSTGEVELLRRPLSDAEVVDALKSAAVSAIDVPLGWPSDFVERIYQHHTEGTWPVDMPDDRLRYRLTDREVSGSGIRPLSVSSDRLGVTAMRGARLQTLLRSAGTAVDRSGVTGAIVEAYPAAALHAWGLPHQRYKGSEHRDGLAALRELVIAACEAHLPSVGTTMHQCDDDALDSVVCAIVAVAARLGMTSRPAPDQIEIARREGWIHVPTAPLSAVLSGASALNPDD
jgi:predicted nuclease with RNAse H fold